MTSDNGTNFVGAVTELKELVGQLDKVKDKIRGASHFGGAHEVMVKAAKRAIYAFLSSSDVTDEELVTDLSQVLKVCLILDHSPISQQTLKMGKWVGSLHQRVSTIGGSAHGRGGTRSKN